MISLTIRKDTHAHKNISHMLIYCCDLLCNCAVTNVQNNTQSVWTPTFLYIFHIHHDRICMPSCCHMLPRAHVIPKWTTLVLPVFALRFGCPPIQLIGVALLSSTRLQDSIKTTTETEYPRCWPSSRPHLAASKMDCNFCASIMLPLIFNLPPMKACIPSSLPSAMATKSASAMVMVQSSEPAASSRSKPVKHQVAHQRT